MNISIMTKITENGTLKSMVYENTRVGNDKFMLIGQRTMNDGKVSRYSGQIGLLLQSVEEFNNTNE